MSTVALQPDLPWTGERMIPFLADPVTEFFHWQRYLYFRPWYSEAKTVIDAACGEGYGAGYISAFGAEVSGCDISKEAIEHAGKKYPGAKFDLKDVCEIDYSKADLVLSFETIEHLPDPKKFLEQLAKCPGTVVISTPNRLNHSPGNSVTDKPLNEFHTIEWTPAEFLELIVGHFPGRTVRMLSQENCFPGRIVERFGDDAKYAIAVIGDLELPHWPTVGISIPTCDGPQRVQDAIFNFSRYYPGVVEFAVVANGSKPETLQKLREMRDAWPYVHLIESDQNLGYGRGTNLGLEHLKKVGYELYAVSNDDVIPTIDCLGTMVSAMQFLQKMGRNPGCIGPVSNSVNGAQLVDIGSFSNYREMAENACEHHRLHLSQVEESVQVRGLFLLITPECLETVGGFDPIFGLGNFEDDDWNLRARLAGFSLWVAGGAFLYHAGSSTFGELQLDYGQNIERNLKLFLEKWGGKSHSEVMHEPVNKADIPLHIPLAAEAPDSGHRLTFGNESVDLIWQATETEFAAAVMMSLASKSRTKRQEILDLLAA